MRWIVRVASRLYWAPLALALSMAFFAGAASADEVGGAGEIRVPSGSASEKTVTEEVLEILLRDGRIDRARYNDMLERHRRERAEMMRPAVAAGPDDPDPEGWSIQWKNGFGVQRNDGYHKLEFGGRIMNDWAIVNYGNGFDERIADAKNANWESGTELRRARIFMEGELFEHVLFKAQYDFAGGVSEFKDVFIGLQKVGPIDKILVGHQKEPFSLEEQTSSKYLTFMERSLANVFSRPARNTGVTFKATAFDSNMTWAVGGFRDTDDFGDDFGSNEDYDVSVRLTGTPWYRDDDARLIHLGASYSHQFRENFTANFAQRPEAHLADRLVNTGDIEDVDGGDLFGGEAAWVQGPWSMQGEFIYQMLSRSPGSSPDFWGAYAETSYFLTGEHRAYKRSAGAFDRVKPIANFSPSAGDWGAWQLAARYSYLDLNDSGIQGGKEDAVTAGVNWYLFPNMRMMMNYVWSRVRGQDSVNLGQARFQIDF